MSLEKRIKDEKPPLGSWVLCEYKPGEKSWGSYQVLFYGYHGTFPAPAFWFYDLVVPDTKLESFQIIEITDSPKI